MGSHYQYTADEAVHMIGFMFDLRVVARGCQPMSPSISFSVSNPFCRVERDYRNKRDEERV